MKLVCIKDGREWFKNSYPYTWELVSKTPNLIIPQKNNIYDCDILEGGLIVIKGSYYQYPKEIFMDLDEFRKNKIDDIL
jgi:hypothetical protein